MPNTPLTSSGARDLSFITTNPAMDAFQHGQQIAQQQLEAEQRLEAATRQNIENLASAPSRLRTINANADSAVAGAQVATQTVPYKIEDARNTARTGGATADVAQGTVGSRIADAAAGSRLRTTAANVAEQTAPYTVQGAYDATRTGTANADVSVATAPDRVRSSKAQADSAELNNFHKVIERLDAGDLEGAKVIAAQTGQNVPPEVFDNADVRDAVVKAAKHASSAYPNRPQNQAQFMQGFLKDMADRKSQGQPANDPTALYNVPNAPTPQDTSGAHNYEIVNRSETDASGKAIVRSYKIDKRTGEMTPVEGEGGFSRATGAGANGGNSVYQQKRRDWLSVHPGDDQGALDYAAGRRQLSGAELVRSARAQAIQEINGNMQLKFKNETERNAAINRRADENLQRMQQANQRQPAPTQTPAVPAVAPAAPARPQAALPPPAIEPIARARDAIARGAPRAAVIQRLLDNGIDPSGL